MGKSWIVSEIPLESRFDTNTLKKLTQIINS